MMAWVISAGCPDSRGTTAGQQAAAARSPTRLPGRRAVAMGGAEARRPISPAAAAPSGAPPPHSAATGFGRCRQGGIGTAQQGIEPGVELLQPLLLAPWPPADCVYSCSVSLSIRSLSLLTRKISFSIHSLSFLKACSRISKSGSRRQLSVDKNCRHRGSDENDTPLLMELAAGAGEGDVVIGGEQGDQAEDETSDGLGSAEAVETETVKA